MPLTLVLLALGLLGSILMFVAMILALRLPRGGGAYRESALSLRTPTSKQSAM